MIEPEAPQWAVERTQFWAGVLNLQEWNIHLFASYCPGDTPGCDGVTHQQPNINRADITLHAGLEDNEYGEQVILHELLHVAHARIDQAVNCAILPEVPAAAQDLADECYRQRIESYTHHLACALVAWRRGMEKPKKRKS